MMDEKYKGKKIFHKIYWELIQAAQYRGYVTYQEIAQIMFLPLSGNYMGKEVGQILREISQDEHSRERPMLSAIALGTSGYPGSGFYRLATELGYQFEDSPKGRRSFWEKERKRVYHTWQRELKE